MVLLCRVDISGQYRSVELVYEGAVYQPGHQPPVHRQPDTGAHLGRGLSTVRRQEDLAEQDNDTFNTCNLLLFI